MITAKNLSKIYQVGTVNKTALDGVDLEVRDGEFLAICGKSGCGKTTLLNIIGLTDVPTGGALSLDGEDLLGLSKADQAKMRNRKIGYIFQSFYLDLGYSVYTNVEMPLLIAGVEKKKRQELVTEAIRRVGMEEHLKVRANRLSGGEKQRVCIARALVMNLIRV